MSADRLNELAAKCEAGADLETRIREAWALANPKPPKPVETGWFTARHTVERFLAAGAFVDAALTLVPEGWCHTITWLGKNGEATAILFRSDSDVEPRGKATTEALALAAAALRARAAMEG